jgi:hypothetical protein
VNANAFLARAHVRGFLATREVRRNPLINPCLNVLPLARAHVRGFLATNPTYRLNSFRWRRIEP